MAKCKYISRKADKICTGDLSKAITIKKAEIQPSIDVEYSRQFTDSLIGLYAMIRTTSGTVVFNLSNQERVATHEFYVRYLDSVISLNLDIDYVIEYNNKNYVILDIENLNEENRFIKILTSERGNNAIPVNEQ